MSIEFRITPKSEDLFAPRIEELLRRTGARTVYDLGGGANPVLPAETISARGVRYLLVDSSEDQLALAPDAYVKIHADPASPDFHPLEPGDLVLTRFVLEHLADPATFHRNIWETLRPGGFALHFFSTLYDLPFLFNRLLPDAIADRVVRKLQPERELEGRQGKFRAHYRWCRGPSPRQLRRFTELGFEIDSYVAFFGHHYLTRFPRLQRAEDRVARTLATRQVTTLTSYALLVLRKPTGNSQGEDGVSDELQAAGPRAA